MKDSFWIKEIKDKVTKESFQKGQEDCDIAIIGGGFVGLWTAILLKEKAPQKRIVILEKEYCGSGASGRNGGMVMSWWPKISTLIKICGEKEAYELAAESAQAINEIEEFCKNHSIDAEFIKSGWIWTATTNVQRQSWADVKAYTDKIDPSIYKKLPDEEVAKRSGSSIHLEGVIEESNGIVQPFKLAQGLKTVALELGVIIYEDSPAKSIEKTSPAKIVTALGTLSAKKVIIATNVWTNKLIPELANSILPVTSTIVSTDPKPELLKEIGWSGFEAVTDSQLMVGYYRPTKAGRIMYGKGTGKIYYNNKIDDNYGNDPQLVTDTICDFKRTYPIIKDQDITYDWTGPIDRTYDSFPLFGHLKGAPHIIYGVGWSGNGVGPSRVGGKILSSLALGEDNFFSSLKIINRTNIRKFPGEPIRYIGGNMVRNAVRRNEKAYILNQKPRALDLKLASFAPSGLEDKK